MPKSWCPGVARNNTFVSTACKHFTSKSQPCLIIILWRNHFFPAVLLFHKFTLWPVRPWWMTHGTAYRQSCQTWLIKHDKGDDYVFLPKSIWFGNKGSVFPASLRLPWFHSLSVLPFLSERHCLISGGHGARASFLFSHPESTYSLLSVTGKAAWGETRTEIHLHSLTHLREQHQPSLVNHYSLLVFRDFPRWHSGLHFGLIINR